MELGATATVRTIYRRWTTLIADLGRSIEVIIISESDIEMRFGDVNTT